MGGINETKIGGLRLHENAGEVHVHDDDKSVKFVMDALNFKKEIQDALDLLLRGDGVFKINGKNNVPLYIIRDGSSYDISVGGTGVKGKLQRFIRSI